MSNCDEKIKLNIAKTNVKPNKVYNGKCKLIAQNRSFMKNNDVNMKHNMCDGKRQKNIKNAEKDDFKGNRMLSTHLLVEIHNTQLSEKIC